VTTFFSASHWGFYIDHMEVEVLGHKAGASALDKMNNWRAGILTAGEARTRIISRICVDLITTLSIVICVRLSKKTDYALRALFTLVDHHGGSPIPIRELARRNDVPKRFLEQIMLDLKAQGWVESAAGARGGYVLAKSPSQITMGEVVRHFDGILAPIQCVSVTGYKRCSQESVCRFRRVFFDARNYVARLMDRSTLADVARGVPVSDGEKSADSTDGAGI
jgi:Rrf2 family protein